MNTKVLDVPRGLLFEGLAVNPHHRLAAWVDIIDRKIFLSDTNWSQIQSFEYPFIPSNIFTVSKDKAVLLDDRGVVCFYWAGARVERVHDFSSVLVECGMRGNDGVMLSRNQYLFGSMHVNSPRDYPGGVWLSDHGSLTKVADNHIPNLFAQVNGQVLIADSFERKIYIHSSQSGKRLGLWSDLSDQPGEPDGGCVSNDGHIFLANWGASEIVKFDAEGNRIASKNIPAPQPSNCKIVGTTLLVTSASTGLDSSILAKYPDSGRLFQLNLF